MKVSDPNVKFRRKFSKIKNQPELSSFLNNGDHTLNAIALVYNKEGKPLADLELNENKKYLSLDAKLVKVIQENLVDMVVYGRSAAFGRCDTYERIAPKLEGRAYALREYNVDYEDLSLNRCTVKTDSVIPEAFKLGSKTPGEENDCAGAYFIMENYALELFDDIPQVGNLLNLF